MRLFLRLQLIFYEIFTIKLLLRLIYKPYIAQLIFLPSLRFEKRSLHSTHILKKERLSALKLRKEIKLSQYVVET